MGLAQSFYDFYSVPATSYWGIFPASDTGDPGWVTFGYTAQFGNGFSATIAAEERRITQIINARRQRIAGAGGTLNPGGFLSTARVTLFVAGVNAGAGAYGGFQMPDIVANLRIDQAWGSAQIMGALHQVNALYYGTSGGSALTRAAGHPDDKLGWVVGAGFKVNAPFTGVGDYFQFQANYTEGALKYIFQTPNTNWGKTGWSKCRMGCCQRCRLRRQSDGHRRECRHRPPADQRLEHQRSVRTLLEPEVADVTVRRLCGGHVRQHREQPMIVPGWQGTGALCTNGCDKNWNTWWVGSRTQWNVTKDFYMGVDVLYSKLDTRERRHLHGKWRCEHWLRDCLGGCQRPRQGHRTTGHSGSVRTATSIPDRLIMDV